MSPVLRIDNQWQQRLVDEMIDTYAQWREECVAVQHAFDHWTNAPRQDRALALGAYEAALDKEERSSQVYADVVHRVTSSLVPAREPDRPSWRPRRSRKRFLLSHRRFPHRLASNRRANEA
jgi:hypothetical protein